MIGARRFADLLAFGCHDTWRHEDVVDRNLRQTGMAWPARQAAETQEIGAVLHHLDDAGKRRGVEIAHHQFAAGRRFDQLGQNICLPELGAGVGKTDGMDANHRQSAHFRAELGANVGWAIPQGLGVGADDGKLRQDHEIAEIDAVAVGLIGIAVLELCQNPFLLRAHLDQGHHIGIYPEDFSLHRVDIVIVIERVETGDLQLDLIGGGARQCHGSLAGQMRPDTDSEDAKHDQQEGRQQLGPGHEEPDTECGRHHRELQGEVRKHIKGNPEMSKPCPHEAAESQQEPELAFQPARWLALLGSQGRVRLVRGLRRIGSRLVQ